MIKLDMTVQEVNNLLAFVTGKQRLHITGDEAFEFVKIINKLQGAEEVVEEREPIEQIGTGEANSEESE